jgi:hypothetical protein
MKTINFDEKRKEREGKRQMSWEEFDEFLEKKGLARPRNLAVFLFEQLCETIQDKCQPEDCPGSSYDVFRERVKDTLIEDLLYLWYRDNLFECVEHLWRLAQEDADLVNVEWSKLDDFMKDMEEMKKLDDYNKEAVRRAFFR